MNSLTLITEIGSANLSVVTLCTVLTRLLYTGKSNPKRLRSC